MIVRIEYRCDHCTTAFTGTPWVFGVARNDLHFCSQDCRDRWIAPTAQAPGPAPGNASKGEDHG